MNRNILRTTIAMAGILLAAGCGKDDDNNNNVTPAQPTATTDTVMNVTETTADVVYTITVPAGATGVSAELLYDTQPDPIRGVGQRADYQTAPGQYTAHLQNLIPGTTYHVRALASTGSGLVYGRDLSFRTIGIAATGAATTSVNDITVYTALFKGNATATGTQGSIVAKGFVYNTSANPTLATSVSIVAGDAIEGTYELYATNLDKNTDYHVRAYVTYASGATAYGADLTFRTPGYTGEAGGIVVYDKGASSGGWRYLEAAPADYTSGGNLLFTWGCSGTLAGITNAEIGAGPTNTIQLINSCSSEAALACDGYVSGGKSDWFLPSYGEAQAMFNCLQELGLATGDKYWSSTEESAYYAQTASNSLGITVVPKTNGVYVRPMRRY